MKNIRYREPLSGEEIGRIASIQNVAAMRQELKSLRSGDLHRVRQYVVQVEGDISERVGALNEEIEKRDSENIEKSLEPHWTGSWGFWVSVLILIFAAIAALPTILSWVCSRRG